jgi:hypothetical protein
MSSLDTKFVSDVCIFYKCKDLMLNI